MLRQKSYFIGALLVLLLASPIRLLAQETGTNSLNRAGTFQRRGNVGSDDTPREVLSTDEWQRIDHSVELGLTFLAAPQTREGSFPSLRNAHPGVTSLCVLLFMADGHNPGTG